jgi:hypothetical protein
MKLEQRPGFVGTVFDAKGEKSPHACCFLSYQLEGPLAKQQGL